MKKYPVRVKKYFEFYSDGVHKDKFSPGVHEMTVECYTYAVAEGLCESRCIKPENKALGGAPQNKFRDPGLEKRGRGRPRKRPEPNLSTG